MRRHVRDIHRVVESFGIDVRRIDHLGSGHLRVVTDACSIVLGSTPSDHRAMQKFKSQIRKSLR
jgi:hypothetical protein